MSDITLTASVRSNLSTLQSTANLISQTQERLATGQKVNSALDNPNSFFTAASLNNRASDLSNLQDDIGQSVSTLEAADAGISAVSELVDAAKAKANQALQSESADDRAKYAAEFNELRTQIQDIAKDSGYKGKNLLAGDGNDLDVKFNEDGSSSLNIMAVDYTDLANGSLRINEIGTTAAVSAVDNNGTLALGLGTGTDNNQTFDLDGAGAGVSGTTTLDSLADFSTGGTISISTDGGTTTNDFVIGTTGSTVDDLKAFVEANGGDATVDISTGDFVVDTNSNPLAFTYTAAASESGAPFAGVSVAADVAAQDSTTQLSSLSAFDAGDKISMSVAGGTAVEFTVSATSTVQDLSDFISANSDATASVTGGVFTVDTNKDALSFSTSGTGSGFTNTDIAADVAATTGSMWESDATIEATLAELDKAANDLRAQATTFGTNMTVVENRQNFTTNMIETLQVGAGKLTLADMNTEGANLSALQTQQSIATSTLSLATQANQNVLQLLR
ncbi:ABC transporter substrate-binding protein [Rhodobacteraceae bacterium RKSG542]|uniref:flagellin N-terminal helical domain-containing protein n=1 Tax=Pseudovibrio flavus TaxID=2529854 RepID=UPI0012BCC1FD|nr:flagellin [Pseudovibrio flavus]MTI19263.1 ABC transporter substrate-binding protein [Pseudovibrio flavus]